MSNQIKATGYNIVIGSESITELSAFLKKNNYSQYFILCDENSLHYCLPALLSHCKLLRDAEIIETDSGENSKSIEIVANCWQTLIENNADKNSLFINLGGGVISDLGGFIASTYKRGIDFINVPTTLLAMADASVGGKTGIDFGGIKNSIGNIVQPKGVFIYPEFLKTLPYKHMVNGFAEILKIGLIKDKVFFSNTATKLIDNSFSDVSTIKKAIALKNTIVKKDPSETGIRKILNFGHTVGHAVESVFLQKENYLLHGEAVAVGMAVESYLSLQLKRILKQEFDTIILCLKRNFEFPPIEPEDFNDFYTYFKHDKKHKNNHYLFCLLNGIGRCDFDVKVTQTKLKKALLYYNSKIANAS